ncbi:MAG: DNA methyltransferase, partial [Flammeovirgaceae bacterium]
MPLSLNEIRLRANQFTIDWKNQTRERAEKDTFWNEFFNIFGISRKRIASFEPAVKKYGGNKGFIDCFWPGTLLIEHKSAGKNLESAKQQAFDYFPGIKEEDLPKYILVSDFQNFELFDLEDQTEYKFKLSELPQKIELFNFISGYQKRIYHEEDPVNIKASELMGDLHDELKKTGYNSQDLEIFLVRILFILFADDTGVWERDNFGYFIENRTNLDGSDLGLWIAQIFQILNTSPDKRQTNLDEDLQKFSYINGGLFSQNISIASFNSVLREKLLKCCHFDWSLINPSIFGSLFQYVMDGDKRRTFGAHYTEEKNILKTIKPLFLDDLQKEFEKLKSIHDLHKFHDKLASLNFFDPACGCGNFLVITYREIRQLENQVLQKIYQTQSNVLDITSISKVNVDQFYGIEIGDFAAKIAETAMWLMDHIMNIKLSQIMGDYYIRIPLQKAAKIITGNALTTDWGDVLDGKLKSTFISVNNLQGLEAFVDETQINQNSPLEGYDRRSGGGLEISNDEKLPRQSATATPSQAKGDTWQNQQIFIIGNPPFVGSKLQSTEQRQEMAEIFKGTAGAGVMDYVSAWYIKAGELMKINPKIQTAFVSTNSISQGEQVGILWGEMFKKFKVEIKFAHQSFSWSSEARGKAQVTVIIIGFRKNSSSLGAWTGNVQNSPLEGWQPKVDGVFPKTLYTYPDLKGEPIAKTVTNINPYLVEGDNVVIKNISKPICKVPEMGIGNKPVDGGNYLFEKEEMQEFIEKEPLSEKYFKPWIGAKEYFSGIPRYVLLLKDVNPAELRKMPLVLDRIEKVKQFRLASSSIPTQKLAQTPTRFHVENFPEGNSIIVPEVNSTTREYIPMGFIDNKTICSNLVKLVPNTTLYHFGILQSRMHMAWTKYVCGRLGNAIRYSSGVVYNNFPWTGVDGECDELKNSPFSKGVA